MRDELRERLDWSALGTLRLRARQIAEGAWVGSHASRRRGSGLEFAGHRSYVPGDDLRWLDQRALMRHRRPLIKQFETETERSLRLAIDASESMGFRGPEATATKLQYAALLAAALTRVALRSGDPVGLDFLAGARAEGLPPRGGMQAFERVVARLAEVEADGQIAADREALERQLAPVLHRAPRGSVIVLLSDLFELGTDAPDVLGALGTRGRQAVVVQVLDPLEATFDLEGPVRLVSGETGVSVETNASVARARYLERLDALQRGFRDALEAHGGGLVCCRTDADPVRVVREVLKAVQGVGA